MIKAFISKPLQTGGYYGTLLRDHVEEARCRREKQAGSRSILVGLSKEFPYLWASCDWCGKEAYLDDVDGEAPVHRFVTLLNWCVYDPSDKHFCCRQHMVAYLESFEDWP